MRQRRNVFFLRAIQRRESACAPPSSLAYARDTSQCAATNIVRPRIAPSSSPYNFEYVSAGSDQLFVGPASSLVGVQMNVTFSTRATSFGLDRCKYERGTFFSFSLISTFCFNDSAIKNSFSRSEPSHQKMFSGFVRFPISCTQSSTAWFVGFVSPIPLGGNMAGAIFFMK